MYVCVCIYYLQADFYQGFKSEIYFFCEERRELWLKGRLKCPRYTVVASVAVVQGSNISEIMTGLLNLLV